MTQTYRNPVAVLRMQNQRCPECGEAAEDHSGARQFWLRDPLSCDLLPEGVTSRIAKQAELDADRA